MQQYDNFDLFLCGVFFAITTSLWFAYWVIPNDNRNMAIAKCQLELNDRSYDSFKHCSQAVDGVAQQ